MPQTKRQKQMSALVRRKEDLEIYKRLVSEDPAGCEKTGMTDSLKRAQDDVTRLQAILGIHT